MGIGDWGLGIGDWAQSPIPNPQSPIPNPQSPSLIQLNNFTNNKILFNFLLKLNLSNSLIIDNINKKYLIIFNQN